MSENKTAGAESSPNLTNVFIGIAVLLVVFAVAGRGVFWSTPPQSIPQSPSGPALLEMMAMPVRDVPKDYLVAVGVLRGMEIFDDNGNRSDGGLEYLERHIERTWLGEQLGLKQALPQTIGEAIKAEKQLEESNPSGLLALREQVYTSVLLPQPAEETAPAPPEFKASPEKFQRYDANIWHEPVLRVMYRYVSGDYVWDLGPTYLVIALQNRAKQTAFLPKYVGVFVKLPDASNEIELACHGTSQLSIHGGSEWISLPSSLNALVLCQVAGNKKGEGWPAAAPKEHSDIKLARQISQVLEAREGVKIRPSAFFDTRWSDRQASNINYPLQVVDLLWTPEISKEVNSRIRQLAVQSKRGYALCFREGDCFTRFVSLLLDDLWWLHGVLSGACIFSLLHFIKPPWSLHFAWCLTGLTLVLSIIFYVGILSSGLPGIAGEFLIAWSAITTIGAMLGIWLMYGLFHALAHRGNAGHGAPKTS